MAKRMLIDASHDEETRVVISDESQIFDFDFVSSTKKQLKGNIYLAKITRVEPSLQAAFVEYGGGKQGFLPFAEIHADYYQIPVSDREKLLAEEKQEEEPFEEDGLQENDSQEKNKPYTESDSKNFSDSTTSYSDIDNIDKTTEEASGEELSEERKTPSYLAQPPFEFIGTAADEQPIKTEENTDEIKKERSFAVENEEQPSEGSKNVESLEGYNSTQSRESENTGDSEDGVETISDDLEDELQNKRKRRMFTRRYKIQEVIRRGQVVLVQVIKEERGNKGVSLTTYLSLAGRYCVLMPNSPKDGGISRKIASAEDRKRLKAISTEFRLAEGMSVIIRTAGIDRTHAEIKRDFDYLVKLWNSIREKTLTSNAPALIYEESDIVKRAIRDQYTGDIEEIIIEGDEAYKSAREFMKLLLPSHLPKIKRYSAQTPLFYAHDIEEQLLSMHDPVVKMKSGAYLVINPTEALISIDVNSGRATGERNIEETALRTNLDAAAEVAKQLRLRDLAGLVVIDFIDMVESKNRRAVEKMLKDSMKTDRAKIQLGRISPFGLLEMSRQRMRPSISETNMIQCQHCNGRGVIRSNESMSIQIIRAVEKEVSGGNISEIRVSAPQETAVYILNSKRGVISELEKLYNVVIKIGIDSKLAESEFNIERIRRNQQERGDGGETRRPKRNERQKGKGGKKNYNDSNFDNSRQDTADAVIEDVGEGESSEENEITEEKSKRSRRRKGRKMARSGYSSGSDESSSYTDDNIESVEENEQSEIADDSVEEIKSEDVLEIKENSKNSYKRFGERSGRGNRRKWKDSGGRGEVNNIINAAEREDDIPTSWNGGVSELVDGKSLPKFATDNRLAFTQAPPDYKAFHDYKPENESKDIKKEDAAAAAASSSPKKGWWQRMISLDD